MAGGLSEIYSKAQLDELNSMLSKLEDASELQKENENELLGLQISNAQKLYNKRKELLKKEIEDRKQAEETYLNIAIKKGTDSQVILRKLELENEKRIKKLEAINTRKDAIKKISAVDKEEKKAKIKKAKLEEKERLKEISAKYKEDIREFNKTLSVKEKLTLASAKRITNAKTREEIKSQNATNLFGSGKTVSERKDAFNSLISNPSSFVSAISDLAAQLDSTIESIASAKSAIDTRLQGSRQANKNGSYWDKMSSDITSYVGASPYVKQADIVNNLKTMVGKGISFNVEQRAFLETISDKIATTFDATQTSLVKLVRIQQQDTTAARLGMESALTSFLNNMYETTEYMTDMATQVKDNIYEASALMAAKSATEFEYQIQKWMGSLYSVGFGTDLSSALGGLAAGNISSIGEGGLGNLLVMAANNANMSIAEILANGLDASETNQLMQAMVSYLSNIYSETKGSNILAQQYASVFGLKASDLKAAANLASSLGNISNNSLNYTGMMAQLNNMASSMGSRISLGERLSNVFSNFQYSTAAGIANSAALYSVYKIANLLEDTVGGVDFSMPLVFGSGTTQTFNVADIMKTSALSVSILSGLSTMLGGAFTSGGDLLSKFGIGTSNVVSRGTGSGLLTTSGTSVSSSGYTTNADSTAITSKTMTDAADESNAQTVEALDESEEKTLTDVDNNVIKIYELLASVIYGGSIKVDMGNESAWSALVRDNQRY